MTQSSSPKPSLKSHPFTPSPRPTFRRQLLLTIAPLVLLPLVLVSIADYWVMGQNLKQRMMQQIQNQSLLANQGTQELLATSRKLPALIAESPTVIEAARYASQQVQTEQLEKLPPNELEKRFGNSKVLQPNQFLNNYLAQTAKTLGLAELSFTEQHGFNVASSHPRDHLVERNRDWWQQAKNKGQGLLSAARSEATKSVNIELIQAITDPQTGQFLGVVKAALPVSKFDRITNYLKNTDLRSSQTVQLLDTSQPEKALASINIKEGRGRDQIIGGEVPLAVGKLLVQVSQGQPLDLQDALGKLQTKYNLVSWDEAKIAGANSLVSFTYGDQQGANRYYSIAAIPGTNWITIASIDTGEMAGVGRELLGILGLITVLLGAVAIAIVLLLSRQLSAPLRNLDKTATQITLGNLDVVAESSGTRETQTLAQSLNHLIANVKELLHQQKQSLEQLQQSREQAEQQAEERQHKNESLERDLSELIVNIEGAASGDLTVRADLSFGEIGIVADFFNAIVESLREIVIQVKDAANQVNHDLGKNQLAILQLTDEALQQASQISQALDAVEQMSQSIQEVAEDAQTAAAVAHAASDTAVSGNKTMDRTVASILQLRETVGDTSQKVKRLGKACLQISKVIALINEIALKTNYLAVNAGIEAAKAGEEGQGFAIVAKEVGGLASQSATATREIEEILANIQEETEQVVAAMERGTTEMTEGTRLVEEAKQSLRKIVQVSHQIDQIVQSISCSAASVSFNSQTVQQLMAAIAQVAEHTSTSSGQISNSLQDTVAIAQQLQASVSTFRVTQE